MREDEPPVVARPAADVTTLPHPWEWWDNGRRAPRPIPSSEEPGPDDVVLDHEPAVWGRRHWRRGEWRIDPLPRAHPDAVHHPERWWVLDTGLRPYPGTVPLQVYDPELRVVRAPAGTPLPPGWAVPAAEGAALAWRAPLGMDAAEAVAAWSDHRVVPHRLLSVFVQRQPSGRWVARRGDGLGAIGEADAEEAAAELGVRRMRELQAGEWRRARRRCGGRLDWVGWPEVPPEPEVRRPAPVA